jgi:hypothetical protein
MANPVIGDVRPATARVSVRGDKKSKAVELKYRSKCAMAWTTATASLGENRGFIAILDLPLTADTVYAYDPSYQVAGTAPGRSTSTPSSACQRDVARGPLALVFANEADPYFGMSRPPALRRPPRQAAAHPPVLRVPKPPRGWSPEGVCQSPSAPLVTQT